MVHKQKSCCSTQGKRLSKGREMEIPDSIREELEQLGGFKALADRIPQPKDLEEKSRIYHALSDPLRLTILHLLKGQPLCVCVINRFMQISGSKLSYHLAILKESGLIAGEYEGNWIIYRLTDKGSMFIRKK
jgi:ArsR family transcriptional regulator, arsenate/arsenite/antimonite-responsive transcriptional repressor